MLQILRRPVATEIRLVVAALGDARLAACFDLSAALANVDRTFTALDALPTLPLRSGTEPVL